MEEWQTHNLVAARQLSTQLVQDAHAQLDFCLGVEKSTHVGFQGRRALR
jgi:hypothetical protein